MTSGAEANPHGERYCPTCEQSFSSGERCPDDGTRLVRIAMGDDALIGRELDGRYTILERLGRGGMGTVYLGKQHSVGREVAIKVVTPSLVSDPVVIKRFLRESKLSSALSHPNAVSVLDFGQTEDGLFYLIMELVNGRTLDAVLEAEPTLPAQRIVRIGTQICEALDGAHQLKIVHRDLKPANVMLLASGRDLVKVLDFGLAKSLTPRLGRATMTNAGALLGTPAYMPPELVTGGESDHRADLYSLGCVLYQMASGRVPFAATTIHELIAMHASEPMPPLRDVSTRLAQVIEKLLEKDPANRYQSAAEARDALEQSLVDEDSHTTLVKPASLVASWSTTGPTPLPVVTAAPVQPVTQDATQPTLVRRHNSEDVPTIAKPVREDTDPALVIDIAPSNDTAPVAVISAKPVDVPAPPPVPPARDATPPPRDLTTDPVRKLPPAPASRHGWLIPVVLVIAIAASIGAYLLVRRGSSNPTAPAAAPSQATPRQPEPAEAPKPASGRRHLTR